MTGEFTKVGIFCGDIISFTIGLVTRNRFVQCSTRLNRQEIRVLWQGDFLMGADEDFDVTHRLTMLGVNEISAFSVQMKKVLEHT